MDEHTLIEFNKTTADLLAILNSLTEEQLNYTPTQDWTIGQFGVHLLKSYAFIGILNGTTKPTTRPFDQKLPPIEKIFSDQTIKMESPEAIKPSQENTNKTKLINSLNKRIEQIRLAIQTLDLSETCIDFSIPQYGEFTRYEGVWFNIYHTRRHVWQIKNRLNLPVESYY
ncbi:MAG: DinB family protein [Sphingobacterium sp.]